MPASVAVVQDVIIKKGGCELQPSFSFTWEFGQQWCVTGPTGSGKTTFLKILSGLSFAIGGKITFPVLEEIKKTSEKQVFISDMIAFVPQEIKIPAGYIEDLYYQRRFQAAEQDDIPNTKEVLLRAANEDEARVSEAAELMALTPLLEQPFVQLSNGQTRRLMIAIALVKQPEILILDNPYTGLDQETRVALNEQIKVLIEHGIHIFIAAHEHELPAIDFVTNIIRLQPVMKLESLNTALLPEEYRIVNFSETDSVIRMENIHVRYGEKVVLKIPHWEVKSSERWIIQGKNGSGKSTLLSVVMADHPQAYANEIYLFGKKRGTGESIWEIKKRIGFFSPELLRYFEHRLTGEEVIASGWSDYVGQVPALTPERKQQVQKLADWLGITSLLQIRMGDLSLGQQKMILIARAMFRNPEVLILDEPLQGMDVQWREHFKKKIDEFAQNRTVLYVTHDSEEIPGGEWQVLGLG